MGFNSGFKGLIYVTLLSHTLLFFFPSFCLLIFNVFNYFVQTVGHLVLACDYIFFRSFTLISKAKLINTYLLTPWSRVLLEKLTSKLCSQSRNSPHLWNPKAPHRTHKCPPPVQRKHLKLWVILNMCFFFHGQGLIAPRPTPKLEDHPSSAVRGCLFNLFTATLHIGGRSSTRNNL